MSPALLIVDDEQPIRSLLQCLLQAYGVETAASVREALNVFHAHRHRLVITDLEMPNGTGWSLADTIKAIDATTIVILITGSLVDTELLQRHKIDYYFPKPFDIQTLQTVVANCLTSVPRR